MESAANHSLYEISFSSSEACGISHQLVILL